MKHLIIGGVAGGATAAARIRRVDEFAEIILIEKGDYISYANCGLPYYIGDVIEERNKLFVQTPQSFSKRFNIDVRVATEAISIDRVTKSVTLRDKNGMITTENYDKLLLAPGAIPVRPPLDGIDSKGIFTLRNVNDTDQIKAFINTEEAKRAVIVGGGFIGLEMAENLHHAGLTVSLVEMGNQVMAPVDFSIAAQVHQHLINKQVSLFLEESVISFKKVDKGLQVLLKSGKVIETDLVILSIGVRPLTALATTAGIDLDETGGISVNEYLQTSDQNIYAVGDAIAYNHPVTGKKWLNYLANPANRQARIVADNMVNDNSVSYEGAIGTAIAKVFDLTVATTGVAAKHLKKAGINYISSTTHGSSHASYYPEAMPLSIKLTFAPETGKIFGAQVIGYDGVDKRIDQIALIIKQSGSIYDLMKLEQAYAPPFSSAKDPIAIAGYVAGNILNDRMPIITWREVKDSDASKITLLDVRTAEEHSFGSINGSMNIPLDELRDRLNEIPHNKPIVVYCAVGLRGYLALLILKARGFNDVRNLSGGYKTYSSATASISSQPMATIKNQNKKGKETMLQDKTVIKVNACGLQCPGPVMRLKESIDKIKSGELVEIVATDAGFARDAQAWCNTTGNTLIKSGEENGKYSVTIEKGNKSSCSMIQREADKGKTFILFSDDLDKALATFVLANGAAATGKPVTIFFTFWGLNTIKKDKKPKVKKDIFGKMFSIMLPSSSLKLHLSKMSMFGIGDRLMRHIMKKKQIESLETLRQQAIDGGVEFIACQMSMDVMGVAREELLNNVTIGGVATYMERAETANVNLFI